MSQPLKTRATDASVADFLAQRASGDRLADCNKLVAIMQRAAGAQARMWGDSIVGFGAYRYRYESGHEGEWPLVGFSPRKSELSLYIMAGFAAHDDLLGRLGKHRNGKSCLYIKRLADIDLEVLTMLIDRSVAAMASRRSDEPVA